MTGSPQVVAGRSSEVASADARDASAAPAIGPRFRSRFGGLWIDLSNARDVIDGKAALGWISAQEAELLKRWSDDGFVILPQAVPHDLIDRLDADVEQVWDGTSAQRCFVSTVLIDKSQASFRLHSARATISFSWKEENRDLAGD